MHQSNETIINRRRLLVLGAATLTGLLTTKNALANPQTPQFNPTWPAHARFHDIAMLHLLNGVCILALWLMWRRSPEPEIGVRVAALIPIIFWGAFFYTTFLVPGTSLKASPDESLPIIAGIPLYPNVIVAAIDVALAILGYWLYRSGNMVTNSESVSE
jgi:hypothetical protein